MNGQKKAKLRRLFAKHPDQFTAIAGQLVEFLAHNQGHKFSLDALAHNYSAFWTKEAVEVALWYAIDQDALHTNYAGEVWWALPMIFPPSEVDIQIQDAMVPTQANP